MGGPKPGHEGELVAPPGAMLDNAVDYALAHGMDFDDVFDHVDNYIANARDEAEAEEAEEEEEETE